MNAEKKSVGFVTPQQRDEIQALYERKNSLKELFLIVGSDNTDLYERVVKDMAETQKRFDLWWSKMAEEYKWEGVSAASWEIDLKTGEIFLIL